MPSPQLLAGICIAACAIAIDSSKVAGQAISNRPQPAIKVTLLGTAPGPPVRVGQAGISTLIEANGQRFLFDAGYGSLERLVESGLPMDAVSRVFLTHLHSDHVADLSALILLPWSGPSERDVPLEVWGPAGTTAMLRNLRRAFAFDIHVRRDVDERAPAAGIEVIGHDIRQGTVYDRDGVKITAFLVDHGPVKPAFGYRIDYAGRSVALSGDTRPNDNLVAFSKGVDLLIHEAVDDVSLRRLAPSERLFNAIVAHHTTPEQAADIFRRVGPRLAVFSHAQGGPAVVERTRRSYSGRVEIGEDLMVIEVGDDVILRHHEATAARDPQAPPAPIVGPPSDAVAVEKHPPLDATGNFTIAPTSTWADVPAMKTAENVPRGTVTMFTMRSDETQMFPGVAGPYTRNVWVYVPAGYVPGTALPLMVDHDGRADAVIQSQLIVVMDNLIAQKRLPMMAGVFIANGGDFRPSERSLEYDTVSGKYAEFIEHEVLPLAEQTAHVKFTSDPELRGVIGQSSGSAAALAMAWFHPEWYHRVISYSGTFVNIQRNEEFPRGAWAYHETLIPNTPRKPLRIWLEVGSRDNGFRSAEDTYRNWPLANNRMADALKAKGYAYQYVWAQDAGHVERGVERQTLEEAMEWVWKRQ